MTTNPKEQGASRLIEAACCLRKALYHMVVSGNVEQ